MPKHLAAYVVDLDLEKTKTGYKNIEVHRASHCMWRLPRARLHHMHNELQEASVSVILRTSMDIFS